MLRFNYNLRSFKPLKRHFNTSYVTVQPVEKAWNTPEMIISIHPMLRFNANSLANILNCIDYFNTSYVTVQPHWCYVIYIFHHT